MKSDARVFELGKSGDKKDLGRRVARRAKGSTKEVDSSTGEHRLLSARARHARLCAKALACLTLTGIILLVLSLMILHARWDLYLRARTVRCAVPADIAALFGSRER